jgi:hypothetical protein
MITLIIGLIACAVGFYCLLKPDNFLLPYLNYYYDPKNPLKPVVRSGGFGSQQIKQFGKTPGMLLWMRIFGAVLCVVGIGFALAYLKVI